MIAIFLIRIYGCGDVALPVGHRHHRAGVERRLLLDPDFRRGCRQCRRQPLGWRPAQIGNYRILLMTVMMFGVVGYGLVYAVPVAASFVICTLIILPVYNAMNALLFANVRAVANASGGRDAAAINSGVRAAISVAWVPVPGLVALVLAGSGSMLPAYLLACLGCTANLALVYFKLPAGGAPPPISHRHSYLASFTEVLSPKVFARLMAVSLITSTLHVNAAVQPLIITGAVGGKVTDIGAIVGIVAFLEIVFIFVGRASKAPPAPGNGACSRHGVLCGLSGIARLFVRTLADLCPDAAQRIRGRGADQHSDNLYPGPDRRPSGAWEARLFRSTCSERRA